MLTSLVPSSPFFLLLPRRHSRRVREQARVGLEELDEGEARSVAHGVLLVPGEKANIYVGNSGV